ncbi:MAG: hypothetical protein JSS79_15885 [Bacteroidetes bacterium]|nr:hypothetical protein [Bacteroidota bacterium]
MNTRTFFLALTLTALTSGAFATANESSMSVVAGANASIFKVVYKAASANRVEVTIRNSNNESVFSETFNKMTAFVRPYNFSELPEGEYTIELNDEQGKKVEKVNYSLGAVKSLIRVTKLNSDPSKFMLTVGNQGANEISVEISNASGESVHNGTYSVEGDFAVVYKLIVAGSYTFVVTDKAGNVQTIKY